MLLNAKLMLGEARAEGYAIGAFNTYNLEITKAILQAAEARRAPVILQVGSKALQFAGEGPLSALLLEAARASSVPVAVHLDHCSEIDQIQRAVGRGFTSVMVDGSHLPFEQNVGLTRRAINACWPVNVPVEAELGGISGMEDSATSLNPGMAFTDPAQAEEFVSLTECDSLAVSVGNVHGFYKGEPNIDYALLEEIGKRVPVPLVLHGTSGLAEEVIRRSIALGVAKFNVNTELRVAFFTTLQQSLASDNGNYDYIRAFSQVVTAIQQVVEQKLELFGSAGRV